MHSQRRRQGGFRSNCPVAWIDDGRTIYSSENPHARFPAGEGIPRRKPLWERGFPICDGPSTSNTSFLQLSGRNVQPSLEEDAVLMSRDELENCSPSRKDGINLTKETHLRYSYCAFLQDLGFQLNLPQTTIGTAMVLCHRFFVRRSHACHDRFLIATAALFLAAKYEETPSPLNTVVRVSWEICERYNSPGVRFLLPADWFDQYRESVISAEHMILTTLNFELEVQHPYTPLKSVLHKLGLSQSVVLNLALNLINEGLRSSLWLQFKPRHIAAGAAFLAAQLLNFDRAYYQGLWQEFQTTPSILLEVAQQLYELTGDGRHLSVFL